ncbi:MFS transporter [Rhodoluna sp.]|jgi:MFS family permease|uniref:MFS transporter n=1 Tax=Rhodoluna sp. TaxID=1969481 RepID=UPI0025E9BA5D|nr:MFS transporter [Rhodoluna sp.]
MPGKSKFKVKELVMPVYLPAVLFSIGEAGLIPIIPASAEHMGADLATAGIIAGLVMFGTVLADLPAARLVNRLGERRSMIAAAFVAATGILFSVFATNIFMLGLGVFIIGGTASVFGLARHSYIAETVPFEFRARSLSILGGMFRLGSFLGPLIGAGVIAWFGIESVYWMAVVFCGLAGITLLTTKPEAMADTPPNVAGGVWKVAVAERHKLLTLGTASGILALARTARNIGLPLWALFIGLPVEQAALLIGLAGALDFALFYVGGKAIDKRGRRFAAVPTLVAMGIGLGLIGLSTDAWSFLAVAIVLSVANAMGAGLVMVIGADLAPAGARNEFLAAYRIFLDGGIAAAAPILSVLTATISLAAGLTTIGGLSVFGAWLMWRYLPHHGIK